METKSYTTIDRKAAEWPSGPWDDEPDKMQWPDAETELPCLAVRNSHNGNWCGYVGVSEGHPLFQVGYNEAMIGDDCIEVHGGLTFADMCQPRDDESVGICHVPAEGEPDHVWWLGFDCAHSFDWSPRDAYYEKTKDGGIWARDHDRNYKSLAYVRSQCANLARQLLSVTAK